jgi:MFS family permease
VGESIVVEGQPEAGGVIGSFFKDTGRSLKSVFGNRNLRLLQLSFCGSLIGNWAYATAVAVWAYGVGGPKAVGIYVALRLALMSVVAPFSATFADKYSRRGVMICADLFSCVTVTAAAVCLYVGTPALPVFVFAIVSALGMSPFRAAEGAIMPSLSRSPAELTASNGTSSTLESVAFCFGPAIAALMLGVASVPAVFLFNAASFVWSIVMVARIRVPRTDAQRAVPEPAASDPAAPDPAAATEELEGKHRGQAAEAEPEKEKEKESYLTELLAGFRAIWKNKDLLLSVIEGCAQTVVSGAEGVLPVVMAVEILHSGPKGVGWLGTSLGIGAILGGIYALSRASKHKLGQDLIAGVMLWSVPLVLVTIWPSPVAAFVAVALLGFGNPLVDVNLYTIVQRITPDAVLGRVFGALEACLIGTMALGAAIAPLLLHLTGLRATCAILGLGVGAVALLGLPRMRLLDKRLEVPEGLTLLRAIPMFTPLNPVVQEALVRSLIPVEFAAGDVIMREGDESDRFYIIESGLVEVTASDGRVLRHERAGDHFGEIGLLHDVPRTATITAMEDTRLLALERREFLDAVTGQGESRRLAEDIATFRLKA